MRWFGRLLTHPSPPTNRTSLLPLSLVLLCFAGSLTPPLKQKQCFLPRPSSKNHSAGVPPANANCMQVTSHKPRVVLQPTRPIKVNISSRVLRTTKAYLELLPNSASSIQCPWLKISLLKVAEDKIGPWLKCIKKAC